MSETSIGVDGGVRQFRPSDLVVGIDGGLVFRQGEFEADIGLHMAVRDMVNHLAHSPAIRTIRCIQLLRRESSNRRPKFGRGPGDFSDPVLPLLRVDRLWERKLS